jgi:hypothetical protein
MQMRKKEIRDGGTRKKNHKNCKPVKDWIRSSLTLGDPNSLMLLKLDSSFLSLPASFGVWSLEVDMGETDKQTGFHNRHYTCENSAWTCCCNDKLFFLLLSERRLFGCSFLELNSMWTGSQFFPSCFTCESVFFQGLFVECHISVSNLCPCLTCVTLLISIHYLNIRTCSRRNNFDWWCFCCPKSICLIFVGLSRDTLNIFVPSLDFTPPSLLISRL